MYCQKCGISFEIDRSDEDGPICSSCANTMWAETKDGRIVDRNGKFVMSAAVLHAMSRTVEINQPLLTYGTYEFGEKVIRKIRISHKTY